MARSAGQANRARGGSGCGGEGVKHRILVVEDNPLNRELLCDWLEAEGHEVWSANDLTAAMRSIEERPPHIVLLDVQLGDEDGLSLAAWMRKQLRLCCCRPSAFGLWYAWGNDSLRARILVGDDHAPSCELVSEILRSADFEATSPSSGAEAAERME